jgi:hypothetical protein
MSECVAEDVKGGCMAPNREAVGVKGVHMAPNGEVLCNRWCCEDSSNLRMIHKSEYVPCKSNALEC